MQSTLKIQLVERLFNRMWRNTRSSETRGHQRAFAKSAQKTEKLEKDFRTTKASRKQF